MTPHHREALGLVAEILTLAPDLRLGQLFAHLGFLGDCDFGRGLGNLDDDEMVTVLYRHRDELRARQPAEPRAV